MDCAAQNGHLDVLRWLDAHRYEGCTSWAMDHAAENGHLDVIEWLHNARNRGSKCTFHAMDYAAKNGHLEIVEFLHEHRTEGCTAQAMNRSEEHTSELQSLMRISYAVFCLKKKKQKKSK